VFLNKHFGDPTITDDVEDIIRNLGYIFRTRRGSGYFRPTFGLTGPGHRTRDEMVLLLKGEIEENIRLYEPRVELMDVAEVQDDKDGLPLIVAKMKILGTMLGLKLKAHLVSRVFRMEVFDLKAGKKGKGR